MIGTMIRLALVLASAGAIATGAHVARTSIEAPSRRAQRPGHSPPRAAPAALPDSAIHLAIATAPFRLRRVPSATRYDPVKAAAPPSPAAPRPPKPALILSGIVWGSTPAAAIEGIPGVDGSRLLSKGDTIAGLRIRRIGRSEVVVAGFDTTWVLTVREVWQ